MTPGKTNADIPLGAVSVKELSRQEKRIKRAREALERWLRGECSGLVYFMDGTTPRVIEFPRSIE